jgi:hypothetical protein
MIRRTLLDGASEFKIILTVSHKTTLIHHLEQQYEKEKHFEVFTDYL